MTTRVFWEVAGGVRGACCCFAVMRICTGEVRGLLRDHQRYPLPVIAR